MSASFLEVLPSPELQRLLVALSEKQALTTKMMIAAKHQKWHVALSLLNPSDDRSFVRKLADYVVRLGYPGADGTDTGSSVVENVPVQGKLSDVVVSWSHSESELKREVGNIRSCLDVLGIFDQAGQYRLENAHVTAKVLGFGEVSVEMDRQKRQWTAKGDLNLSSLLAMVHHLVPGLVKLQIGGAWQKPMAETDSRDQLVGAILALQLQSHGAVPTCSEMLDLRANWYDPDYPVHAMEQRWNDTILPAKAFLAETFKALEHHLWDAAEICPVERYRNEYATFLQMIREGHWDTVVRMLPNIERTIAPYASDHSFSLFAANVLMQAQIGRFENKLTEVLQARLAGQESASPHCKP